MLGALARIHPWQWKERAMRMKYRVFAERELGGSRELWGVVVDHDGKGKQRQPFILAGTAARALDLLAERLRRQQAGFPKPENAGRLIPEKRYHSGGLVSGSKPYRVGEK